MRTIYDTKQLLIACLSVITFIQSVSACPCNDITIPKDGAKETNTAKGLAYSRTSAYKKEFDKAIKDARSTCQKHLGERKVAIVSDLDETLLDNRRFFEKHPEFHWKDFDVWVNDAKAPSLKKTADLLAWARKKGFAIFFITGRMELLRSGTIANLVNNGIAYDGLYMRTDGDKSPAEKVKAAYRKKIEDLGFKIIVNIGDQYSDLAGGFSEDCEKLPNKIYFIP
ncbi:MAG: HAD family acid phosphatase [Candidatus Obscuribacterales bacterium]|nr:HAD family acid phosphatase [Candidatus Obscuribacterales bacterium]